MARALNTVPACSTRTAHLKGARRNTGHLCEVDRDNASLALPEGLLEAPRSPRHIMYYDLIRLMEDRASSAFARITSALASSACDEGFDIHQASRYPNALHGLRIDPRRLMSQLLHVLNVRPRINRGMAVRAALAAQFQHT